MIPLIDIDIPLNTVNYPFKVSAEYKHDTATVCADLDLGKCETVVTSSVLRTRICLICNYLASWIRVYIFHNYF